MTRQLRQPAPVARTQAHNRGFSLFELIIVMVVLALSSGVLFGRIVNYQELAEKSAMENTAGAVRSALAIQVASLVGRGKLDELPKLANINPMNLLAEVPNNYLGEYYGQVDDVQPGSWYFDLQARQLVYLVRHVECFQTQKPGIKAVRYQVSLVYNDWSAANANGKDIGGIVLKEVTPYTWNVK